MFFYIKDSAEIERAPTYIGAHFLFCISAYALHLRRLVHRVPDSLPQ